jgi:hypothetical protein
VKTALLFAYSTLAVLASINAVPFWAAIAAAITAGAVGFWRSPSHEASAWDLLAFAPLLPLLLWVTTPGADAAMYAAQARALLDGTGELSAAYPGVRVAMYPLGFPALIAVLTPLAGIAKAALLAAICGYALLALALAEFLERFVPKRYALFAAIAICVVPRNVPMGVFFWGGNPTIFAFALAVFALLRNNPLLLAGAFSTHPIGAFAGLACAPFIVRDARALIAIVPVAPLLLCFNRFGPEISSAETHLIEAWQAGPASFVQDKLHNFALDYLSSFSRTCGDAFAIAVYASMAAAWWLKERRAAAMALFGLVYVGVLMKVGPHLPILGPLLYADRLPQIWLIAFGPALVLCARRLPAAAVAPICVALVLLTHRNWSIPPALLDDDGLAISRCVAQTVPRGEWIVASYGQSGQWFPALIDRPITQAHVHVSLFDEVGAQRRTMRSRFQFLSATPALYVTALPPLPSSEVVCAHGGAKLVRLQELADAGPEPW